MERFSFDLLLLAIALGPLAALGLWRDARWGWWLLATAVLIIAIVQAPLGLRFVLIGETSCLPLLVLTLRRRSHLGMMSARWGGILKKGAKWALAGVILLGVLFVLLVAAVIYGWSTFGDQVLRGRAITSATIRESEKRMRLRFPPSTSFLMVDLIYSFQNDAILLKCTVPRKDLPALLAASPFAGAKLHSNHNFTPNTNGGPAGWDPESAHPFLSAQLDFDPSALLMITIGQPDSERPTVYLYVFDHAR